MEADDRVPISGSSAVPCIFLNEECTIDGRAKTGAPFDKVSRSFSKAHEPGQTTRLFLIASKKLRGKFIFLCEEGASAVNRFHGSQRPDSPSRKSDRRTDFMRRFS
ncbi:MAG: hypothetical protein LJE94_14795 [Deltaproteobacteria bacterium]|nr:hypothetical protein [Deltaproteobacteria bacterium]